MPDRGTMAPTPGEALCTAQDVALNGFWQAYAPRKTAEQIVKDGHGLSCGRCLRRLLWHGRWALRPPGAATPCAHAPTTTVLVQVPVRQVPWTRVGSVCAPNSLVAEGFGPNVGLVPRLGSHR